MELLIRNLDRNSTKSSYKKVVWFYNFWSWLTESKAAKYVIEFADIKNKETVLEIACGTGVVFEKLVKRNPEGKTVGIDLSPDMLSKAKGRLKKYANANYELKEGDVLAFDFEDNYFDTVVNNFMVDLMPANTFDRIAEEFYRVTKPNGKVVLSTFSFGKKKINKFWFWVAKKFPDLLTGCRPVSFKEILIRAGFEIEKSLEISQNTFPSEVIKARKVIKN
jgi:ubiquinone/menaquinone biosynthesis C-methylase UbiE